MGLQSVMMAAKAKLCIRSVLNSAVGMDALLDKDCFAALLSECLSSTFDGLRYQAVEILAAVSLYSKRGRHFALDFLHARAETHGSHVAGKRWWIAAQFLRPGVPVPTITAMVIMMSTLIKHSCEWCGRGRTDQTATHPAPTRRVSHPSPFPSPAPQSMA